MLAIPPFVPQPKIEGTNTVHPHCWAAALSSWLKANPRRTSVSTEDLIKNLKEFTIGRSGALDAKNFHKIAATPLVKMAWRTVQGVDLKESDLDSFTSDSVWGGYVYTICRLIGADEKEPSHARVIYGTWMGAAWAMDPMVGDTRWSFNTIKQFKLIIGVPAESTYIAFDNRWVKP